MKDKRAKIVQLEKRWREAAVQESKREEEGYALWDQEETTLSQLVMEYGAMDYLYIIPPDLAPMKLNVHSTIPIPRESWSEVLEILLAHNGVGVKSINAYARQLYIMRQDPSAIEAIASRPEDLNLIPPKARLFYVFSPPVEQVKSTFQFFERFSDAKQTFVYQVGSKIAMVSSRTEVEKLLSLYQSVWEGKEGKVLRVVTLAKIGAKEMEKILQSFFGEAIEKSRPPVGRPEQDGLNVLSLGQGNSLILIGSNSVVDRAEKIIKDTEEQLHDPSEMTVYIYNCRHSDPSDLAKVLEKVYISLLTISPEANKETIDVSYATQGISPKVPDGYAQPAPLVVAPPPLNPGIKGQVEYEKGSDNFIADPKTGNLLMVIRRDALKKIKDLLRKLDIPKKMVQIEVLLFEKQHNTQNGFGLNLLKIGSKNNHVQYTSQDAPMGIGILQFLFKHHYNHFPSVDFSYSFLMTQEDIQLNASPSVITVNQTPATITIVDEISINNGAAPIDTNHGIAFEKSFSRAQYGITIILTPTVHLADTEEDGEDGKGFVTLQMNITFDTPKASHDDRPPVLRRHIENEVRVVDGQTVILGGLRRKTIQDNEEKVPFLGEIPGLGKLFGSTNLKDHNTEMFFFITPTIILDPKEQLDKFRTEELKKRPGDIPEFLERLVDARREENRKFFDNSLKMFFGRDY